MCSKHEEGEEEGDEEEEEGEEEGEEGGEEEEGNGGGGRQWEGKISVGGKEGFLFVGIVLLVGIFFCVGNGFLGGKQSFLFVTNVGISISTL